MKKKILASVLGLIMCCTLASCGNKEGNLKTYRMGPSDLPTSWNSHTYQSNSSTYILDYCSDSLYTFDYNADFTGYEIVPSMAKSMPVDVTANYVGQFGITQEDVTKGGKVYSIELKDNLCFDNGDVINAETFVESMKLLLNPKANNFRADNVYQSGDVKIAGAEEYAKGGKYALGQFVSENYGDDEYVAHTDFTTAENGNIQFTRGGKTYDMIIDINSGGNWGSNGLLKYAQAGYLGDNPRTFSADETRVKYASNDGQIIIWRSAEEVGGAFQWFDAETGGNDVSAQITEDSNGYYFNGTLIAWLNAYDPESSYGKLLKWGGEDGKITLNAETLKFVQDAIAKLHGCDDVEAYAQALEEEEGDPNYAYIEFEEMAFVGSNYDIMPWETVGFLADGNKLVVVLKDAMEYNFYLKYGLCTDFFLVNPTKYKACESTSQGVYTNSYGTSVDTFVGFGPYKLTRYTADSEILLEKNDKWHGFSAGEYQEGTYQFDRIQYKKVATNATRLEMFLKGELDSYGLQAEDMTDYVGSKYTYFNDSESTWYLVMNPQVSTLETNQATATCGIEGKTDWPVIKTPLAIDDFRKAMSYAIDRTALNQAVNPLGSAASSLLSSMIIADPETGKTYRSTEDAKDAVLAFWGLADKVGAGKEFATKDEAIKSITGYDPEGAKQLFASAYDEAVAEGYITQEMITSGKWVVQIVAGMPSTSDFYTKCEGVLANIWTDAVKGTPFEGHIEIVPSQELGSTSFGTYLRNGSVDLLFFVGYSGSMFNPYSMMDCFTGSLQYDPFTDKTAVDLDIEVGGQVLRASLYDWVSKCLQGTEITATVFVDGEATAQTQKISAGASDDQAVRVHILAACEGKIMQLANVFPLSTDASASLRCMRIQYKTEEYILGVGRGGIKYITCTMTDGEFAKFVKKQPGKVLDYTVSED